MIYDLEAQFDVIYEGDETRICCPFCGDEGYHLYLNEKKGVYHCFKCEAKGHISALIKKFKLQPVHVAYKEFIHTPLNAINAKMEAKETPQPSIKLEDFKAISVNAECLNNIYYSYIRERGLRVEDITYYQLHFANSGKYKFRVIFPCFENGKFVYFTARTILADPQHKRYINPPTGLTPKTRSDVIFNIDSLREGFPCIIMEGALNAIITGRDAVATFGKCVSDSQIRLLINKNCSEYIVALDADAKKESLELCKKLINYRKNVRFAQFSDEQDPADLGREVTRDILEGARQMTYANIDLELVKSGITF